MAFQIKDFASVAASMINWCKAVTTKVTDYSIGSVVRTLLEAAAIEIEELYMRMLIGLKEAIPVSVYTSFGFNKLPALPASGMVRFTAPAAVASNLIVPAGTTVRVPGAAILYATTVENFIPTGSTFVDIPVAATTTGTPGNVAAAALTELVTPVTGISAVSNPNAFSNGRDAETDAERKTRFQDYISTLARGTKSALIYGVKTANLTNADGVITEYIGQASVLEPWLTDNAQPVGLVKLYVYSNSGVTSGGLITQAQKIIDGYYDANGVAVPGWKAAGVRVDVTAATSKAVAITGVVTVDSAYVAATVRSAVQAAMSAYIQGLDVGVTVQRAELVAIAKRDVPGVLNITMTVPAADVTCLISEKAVPGVFTLT